MHEPDLISFVSSFFFWGGGGGGGGMPFLLLDRTVECSQESIVWREGGGIGKGPRLSSHCRLKWPKSDFLAQM